MSKITKTRFKTLRELYAVIPDVECKGLCGEMYCKRVLTTKAELANARRAGSDISSATIDLQLVVRGSTHPDLQCPAWSKDEGCTIYAARPTVCRLWGAVIDLICPHGCRPERYLTSEEGVHLVGESIRLGGRNPQMNEMPVTRLVR